MFIFRRLCWFMTLFLSCVSDDHYMPMENMVGKKCKQTNNSSRVVHGTVLCRSGSKSKQFVCLFEVEWPWTHIISQLIWTTTSSNIKWGRHWSILISKSPERKGLETNAEHTTSRPIFWHHRGQFLGLRGSEPLRRSGNQDFPMRFTMKQSKQSILRVRSSSSRWSVYALWMDLCCWSLDAIDKK